MGRLLNMDNPVMRFLSRTFDVMMLNIFFIICSLPIFTIGASLSALHYCCLKMKEPDEGYVWKNFFKSFKVNFKQGIPLWLMMFVLGLVLFMEHRVASQMTGASIKAVRIMIYTAAVLWYMVLAWMFALQSRFVNSIGQTIKNALLLTIAKAPRSIAMVLIMIAEIVIVLRSPAIVQSYAILWIIMFGFAVQVLINTQLQYPVIKELMPKEDTEPVSDSQFTVDETADVSGLGYTSIPKEGDSSGTGSGVSPAGEDREGQDKKDFRM